MSHAIRDVLEQHFDTAFAATDGIAKLRELILTLAMQGKLMEQDPADQPASELLKEIETEKQRLVKAGKIKAPKPLPTIKPEEVPYSLPQGWSWVRVREICHDWGQKTPDSKFTYIDVGAIDNSLGKIGSNIQILGASDAPSRARKIVKAGTVIYSTVRPYLLNIAIIEKEYDPEPIASTAFAILHPFGSLNARFIYYYLRSPAFIRYVEATQKGVAYPAINDGDFFSGLFPLPPLTEQHRIVARIDQLMARCDTLEMLRNEQEEKQLAVHAAAIQQLLEAGDALAWDFIERHFDALYTVKKNVAELRNAILHLAMAGRLSSPMDTDSQVASLLDILQTNQSKNTSLRKSEYDSIHAALKAAANGVVRNRVLLSARLFCEFITKGTTPSANELTDIGEVPFLKVYNIVGNKLDFNYKPSFISVDVHRNKLGRSIIRPNDVIMNIVGPPLGKVAIVTNQFPEWNMNQALAVFRPLGGILSKYVYYALSARSTLKTVLREVKGTAGQDNLSLEQCRDLIIPIPSIEEQCRIVSRIDQLMIQCDTLDQQIDAATKKQSELLGAVMAQV
ncbi:restriction endonuclease subunit S [Acidovorax sp. D2M1]|uniref:Restriction endonuclease subunit S n=1 Tax=Acidovorax benzenivorans TaxID=2987520 RepID=A0ABT5RWK1_9BURK|nr:restriction endonuclease subunit S [Acidovorax benzenivorans]MDD2177760.1 restriction endonuclease subunit S [Acidovorax benzenivorans]